MSQMETETVSRKKLVERSTAAVEKLNDKTETNAKILKLIDKWKSEDSNDPK